MELKRYLKIIWERKWILIQAIGVIVGCALFGAFRMPPIYKASAHVLIDLQDLKPQYISQAPELQLPRNIGVMEYIESRNVVDTYIALAKGPSVVGKVINALDLKDEKGDVIETKDFIVSMPRSPKLIFSQKKGVKVKRMKAAEMLEITGYSDNRQEAAKIANGMAQSFSFFLSELWRQEASAARQSIEKEMLEIELSALFTELYREKTSFSRQVPESYFSGKRGEEAIAEESEGSFRNRQKALEFDNRVSGLIIGLASLEAEKNAIERSFREGYSRLKTAEIPRLEERRNSLLKQIDRKNKEFGEILGGPTDLTHFIGRLQTLGTIYESLKRRLEYAKIAEAMDINNIRIVQPATLSVRAKKDVYFPKKGLILVMAFLTSTAFGLFLCFLSEYLDDRIKTASEVIEKLDQPFLGAIPSVWNGKKLIKGKVKADPGFYNNFWDLVSNIKMATKDDEARVFAVSSVKRGEGKSVVSQYLARTFEESGQRVLLVDVNLRRPCLHKMVNSSNLVGLSQVLKGENKIKDVVVSTDGGKMDIIPAGELRFANPLKIIDSPSLLQFIRQVKQDYDRIIFDTPAMEDGSDAVVIGSRVDSLILVVGSGRDSEGDLKRALGILRKTKASLLGIVLNKVLI